MMEIVKFFMGIAANSPFASGLLIIVLATYSFKAAAKYARDRHKSSKVAKENLRFTSMLVHVVPAGYVVAYLLITL